MIGVGEGSQHRVKMAVQLWMASLRIEDMPKPGVLEEHHAHTLLGCSLGKDRTVAHDAPIGPARPHSGRDDLIVGRGYCSGRTGKRSIDHPIRHIQHGAASPYPIR